MHEHKNFVKIIYTLKEGQINILKDLGLLNDNTKFDWYIYGALAGLVLFVLILQWYYLYKYHEEIFKDVSKLALLNVLNVIKYIFFQQKKSWQSHFNALMLQ